MTSFHCHFCRAVIPFQAGDRIGRRDSCPKCGRDLHICMNCTHFDVSAYNSCKEVRAERVVDKDRSNFCDEFSPNLGPQNAASDPAADAKKKLEALFK